jgi:hypothetical protein
MWTTFPKAPIAKDSMCFFLFLNSSFPSYHNTQANIATSAGSVRDIREDAIAVGRALLLRLAVAYINWKLRSDELKQLDAFTSGTSAGSASVTSAHCSDPVSFNLQ